MSSIDCQICASTFSTKLRKSIECIFCNKCCCKACFAAYTKEQSVPKCMFCSAELTMDFVEENTTSAFQSDYTKFLDDLKFDAEKSKLPATQRLAELTRLCHKYDDEYTTKYRELYTLKHQRRIIKMEYFKLKKNKKIKKVKGVELTVEEKIQLQTEKTVIGELKTKLNEKKGIIEEKKEEINNIFNIKFFHAAEKHQQVNILTGRIQAPVDDGEEKQVYTRPCISDDCRGFLSKSYKCGTCEKQYCADCHEEKNSRVDDEHVCNDDAKATIAMIRRDTKPCPKCSIPIEKVSGCSQMWCVSCHTTFDWNTMRIETGYIHNPEYLRWMRANNREIGRNPYDVQGGCEDMPSWHRVNQQLSVVGIYSLEWDEIHRKYGHIRHSAIPSLPTENETDFIDLRVKYLNSEISDEIWRKKLGMKLKVNRISHERRNVLDMYINALKDLFLNLMQDNDIVQFKNCACELEKYTDTQLNKINKKYKSKNTTYASIKKV